jgi:putative membrane protein
VNLEGEVIVRMTAKLAVLSAGLFVWGGLTAAQDAAKSGAKAGASSADHRFMVKAAQANMAEVELGRLGADKGESADVKKYGQQMVEDHGKASQELQTLAQQEGATLPTYVDKPHQQAKARLEKLSGNAFDRAFAAQMVKDHQAAVALFRTQARSGKDAEVKAWAAKMLPHLEEHLKQAQSLSTQQRASR